jgi:hypothetical protein
LPPTSPPPSGAELLRLPGADLLAPLPGAAGGDLPLGEHPTKPTVEGKQPLGQHSMLTDRPTVIYVVAESDHPGPGGCACGANAAGHGYPGGAIEGSNTLGAGHGGDAYAGADGGGNALGSGPGSYGGGPLDGGGASGAGGLGGAVD